MSQKCKECGGTMRPDGGCNLCELFQVGATFNTTHVEVERLNKPKLSEALGVHPTQVQEAMDDARKRGVPTDFTRDGRAVITSRAHQKALCRAYGFTNKDGCYGD